MILICGGAKAYGAFGITKLADAVIQTAKSAVLRFSQNNACYLLFLLFFAGAFGNHKFHGSMVAYGW